MNIYTKNILNDVTSIKYLHTYIILHMDIYMPGKNYTYD